MVRFRVSMMAISLATSACYSGSWAGEAVDGEGSLDGGSAPTSMGSGDDGAHMPGTSGGGEDPTPDDPSPDDDDDAPGMEGDGLPCEVEALLAARCRSCHGSTPVGGAPNSLISHDDLVAMSLTQPGRTVGEVAVERMRGEGQGQVMPPGAGPSVGADELDPFAAWVASGMPAESCGMGTDDGDPMDDPFDVEPTCTSQRFWTEGLFEDSPRMNPGRACISCHSDPEAFGSDDDDRGPSFWFAGTIYPTAHEPDDCNGVDGEAQNVSIEVTSANGQTQVVVPNRAGNFSLRRNAIENFDPPYTIRILSDAGVRVMGGAAPSGDCNSCHTQTGQNGAPGRIILP